MWVERLPADWFMSKYLFAFSQREPAPEDAPIRAYLAEHGLEPRWQRTEEHAGEPFEVLCFGECYIGPHLRAIAALHRQGVERSAVRYALAELVAGELQAAWAAQTDPLPVAARAALLDRLADAVQPAASYAATDEGVLHAELPADAVRAALARLAEAPCDAG